MNCDTNMAISTYAFQQKRRSYFPWKKYFEMLARMIINYNHRTTHNIQQYKICGGEGSNKDRRKCNFPHWILGASNVIVIRVLVYKLKHWCLVHQNSKLEKINTNVKSLKYVGETKKRQISKFNYDTSTPTRQHVKSWKNRTRQHAKSWKNRTRHYLSTYIYIWFDVLICSK